MGWLYLYIINYMDMFTSILQFLIMKLIENMKKFHLAVLCTILIFSCGSNGKGELVGVQGKKFFSEKPFGMNLIPGGSFIMGKSDDDLVKIDDAPTRTVTVKSFYMDETEITNSEYRQFVNWVRDSIIRTNLAEEALYIEDLESGGLADYAYLDADTSDLGVYDKWAKENLLNQGKLNWDVDLIFDRNDYPDEEYLLVMEGMFLDEDEVFNDVRTWDVKQFKFDYRKSDIKAYLEAKKELTRTIKNEFTSQEIKDDGGLEKMLVDLGLNRSDFIGKQPPLEIYPDTTVWVKDFKYSYNEPMHNNYFWHDAYNDYPVVGITWDQANAFCQWRTMHKNSYQKQKNKTLVPKFRLPTEAEWEYAARGGIEGADFPWGGPYTKDDRGTFLANFKPNRGNYIADCALYTVEADAYEANDFGLYNMSGNVAEWVNSSYESSAYEYNSTMNPNVNNELNNKKITRGGSWKDVQYYLQVSSRDYEYADTPRSYIGFRTVHDYLGSDIEAENTQTNQSRVKK